jgi:hypothetical protein
LITSRCPRSLTPHRRMPHDVRSHHAHLTPDTLSAKGSGVALPHDQQPRTLPARPTAVQNSVVFRLSAREPTPVLPRLGSRGIAPLRPRQSVELPAGYVIDASLTRVRREVPLNRRGDRTAHARGRDPWTCRRHSVRPRRFGRSPASLPCLTVLIVGTGGTAARVAASITAGVRGTAVPTMTT